METVQEVCSHVPQVNVQLWKDHGSDVFVNSCFVCQKPNGDAVCLDCAIILCCGKHMNDHYSKETHPLVMHLDDFSFWCYRCDCRLSHTSFPVLYDIYCLFCERKSAVAQNAVETKQENIAAESQKVEQGPGSTAPYKPYKQGRFQRPSLHQQMNAVKLTPRVGNRLPKEASVEELEIFAQMFPAFLPILLPGPGDWLAENKEEAEDLVTFACSHNKITAERKTIYILPLEDLDPDLSPSLETLRLYAETFFGMTVLLLPPLKSVASKKKPCVVFSTPGYQFEVATKMNIQTKQIQFMAGDLCSVMSRFMPKDTYCMIGITMTDLYSSSDWNFVFGQANLRTKMGVFSFVRYSPLFMTTRTEMTDAEKLLLLRRSCRVLVHEVFHMFGAGHCVYANCCMNGANHLEEDDSQPLFLCPVDLAKLYCVQPFRLLVKLEAIRKFCVTQGFDQDIKLLDMQLLHLRSLQAKTKIQQSKPRNKKKGNDLHETSNSL